jgi:23S rRNA (cytidine1920-2'-O)/16S rRNA (cytidine1409-2'-O)-methyltransferase
MTKPGARLRADVYLVSRGYAASRAEAQAAIAAGRVMADGHTVLKASQPIGHDADISYEKAHPYVSRGAIKLIAALDRFALSPEGLICLDLGASTGGFTQVLLERGAAKIYAVDVGHGQMHRDVTRDPRVVAREGVNARDLSVAQIPERPQAIVADVSFISLKLALPPALKLAAPDAWLVALVKPQFEVGRGNVGKGGVVRDAGARQSARDDIVAWISSVQGWSVPDHMESPVEGSDGNREFLVAARKA